MGDILIKINEIIRERRLAKGFTQEQVANFLGITAPAVNKWEKGTSYPDIVLLPALARLLDTDLNTLLSFQDDLSEKEVVLFMNEVSETMEKDGYEAGYLLADEKLKEYPTCDLLISNLAMLLDGALMLYGGSTKRKYSNQRTGAGMPYFQIDGEAGLRSGTGNTQYNPQEKPCGPGTGSGKHIYSARRAGTGSQND